MIFFCALLALASAQITGKTFLYPDGLGPHFVYQNTLPIPVFKTTLLPSVPAQCTNYATSLNDDGTPFCPNLANFSAFNITISDCAVPWTACYCADADTIPLQDFLQFASRLPPNLRDYVRYFVAFPATGESAFSESHDMVLFGDETSESVMSVFIHENGHDIDDGLSSSAGWLNAINSDSCVPDSYAATNNVEDFAQVNVVALYLDLNNNVFPSGNAVNPSCMSNQINFFRNNNRLNAQAMALKTCDLSVRNPVNQVFQTTAATVQAPVPSSTSS